MEEAHCDDVVAHRDLAEGRGECESEQAVQSTLNSRSFDVLACTPYGKEVRVPWIPAADGRCHCVGCGAGEVLEVHCYANETSGVVVMVAPKVLQVQAAEAEPHRLAREETAVEAVQLLGVQIPIARVLPVRLARSTSSSGIFGKEKSQTMRYPCRS